MSLQRSTKSKINEWVKWFNWHADKVGAYPVDQQVKWLLKATNGAYEIMTLLANEQNNKNRMEIPGFSTSDNGLLIPQTWRFNG